MRAVMKTMTRLVPFAPTLLALAAAVALGSATAAEGDVPSVVITGSVKERVVADAPYAVTVVDRDDLRSSGPLINLSESL